MKIGTTDLVKFRKLKLSLRMPQYAVIGLLESLWMFTSKNSPEGDIGKHSNDDIACMVEWEGDPDELIAVLVKCEWLDEHPEHRLIVHDWSEHAPNWLKGNLARHGRQFADAIVQPAKQPAGSTSQAATKSSQSNPIQATPPLQGACAVETITSDDSPATEQELAEAPPDGPDGIHGYGPVADFLDIWNSLPEGIRGVVRVGGLPARLPPFEERLFEQAWTRRKSDCIAAMAKIQAGGIGWDRSAVTVKEFFGTGMIDELLAGKHERRETAKDPPPEKLKLHLSETMKQYYRDKKKELENAATD